MRLTGQDKFNEALHQELCDNKWALRVNDPCNGEKLDALISASGGSTSVARTIHNVSAITAGNEYSQNLGANCIKYVIKSRGRGEVKLSYVSGGSYITIPAGANMVDEGLSTASLTVYFKSNKPNDIIEIISYNKI